MRRASEYLMQRSGQRGTQQNHQVDTKHAALTVESIAGMTMKKQPKDDIDGAHNEQKAPPDRNRI